MTESLFQGKIKRKFTERDFIRFLISQGIEVKTSTKARGNLGICFTNRIDISKNVPKERRMQVLAHEYAHLVHFRLEGSAFKNGGSLEKIFDTDNISDYSKELFHVTNFVDPNSRTVKSADEKDVLAAQIKELASQIKAGYPEFKRSEPFRCIESILKSCDALHFLKYDRFKLITPILKTEKSYDIADIAVQFPHLSAEAIAYINLRSLERKSKKLSRLKNKADAYYALPTELFARFVEGIFVDKSEVIRFAPRSYSRFMQLLNSGYYGKLSELFVLADII